jgi:hypothetical protein
MCAGMVKTQTSVESRASRTLSRAGVARLSIASFMLAALPGLFQFSFERVLGAVAGLREIAIGAVLDGVGVTVSELALHGVVAGLGAFIRLLRTLAAVGIIEKMVAGTFWHGRPFKVRQ